MMVLMVHKLRPGFRGRLTRHLIQPHSGVFVGHPSARIRQRIWESVCKEIDERGGGAILLEPAATEQGYALMTHGQTPRSVRDFDGLLLPKKPRKA
jgi:CRISPR-associated protein Cas2